MVYINYISIKLEIKIKTGIKKKIPTLRVVSLREGKRMGCEKDGGDFNSCFFNTKGVKQI